MKEIKQHELTLEDIENIDKKGIFIPYSDYGLAEIYKRNSKYELYSISEYGGEPMLELVDSNAQIILSTVRGWC